MIPSAVGVAILLTHVTSRLISTPIDSDTSKEDKTEKTIRLLMVHAGLIVLTLYLLWQPINYAKYSANRSWVFEDPVKSGLPDMPIVMQNADEFIAYNFYSPWRAKYFFILDWEAAVNKNSGTWGPQAFKHFNAYREVYPARFKNNILSTGEFLGKYDSFIVVSHCPDTLKCPEKPIGLAAARTWIGTVDCPQWVAMRLLNNAAYKLTYLTQTDYVTYLLVEKQSHK
jgi:hypothetical protein